MAEVSRQVRELLLGQLGDALMPLAKAVPRVSAVTDALLKPESARAAAPAMLFYLCCCALAWSCLVCAAAALCMYLHCLPGDKLQQQRHGIAACTAHRAAWPQAGMRGIASSS